MSQKELQPAQQEIFDALLPLLVLGTLAISWLAFAFQMATPVSGALTGWALIGRWIATTGAVLFVGGLAWVMRRRGYFRAATYVLILGLTVLIAVGLVLWPEFPGTVLPYLYPLMVIAAGFVMRPNAAIQTLVLIVLVVPVALLVGGELTFLAISQLLPSLLLTSLTAIVVLLSGGHMMAALTRAAQVESQSKQQLEQAVGHLKASRANQTMSRRILKETRSATSQLLANLSHDFRLRINAIVNFSHLLAEGRRGPVTSEQLTYLRRMHDTGERILRSLADLADLSSIEAGQIELGYQRVNLSQLGTETIQTMVSVTQGKQLALYNTIPSDFPQPLSDESRIRQVLVSLLENAIQHTERGRVTLSARAQNGEVEVSVSDTGAGILPEDLEHAFEPFDRLRNVSIQSRLSSGVGLAVSKGLVELHGGRMWVESQVGTGSTFRFTLPLLPPPGLPLEDQEDADEESPQFEATLLSLWPHGERPELSPQTTSQMGTGARVTPIIRQRFIAVAFVALLSILSLVIGGISLRMRDRGENVSSQQGTTPTIAVVYVDATPTRSPAQVESPTPALVSTLTLSPTPTLIATSTMTSEATSTAVQVTPKATSTAVPSPASTPSPSRTPVPTPTPTSQLSTPPLPPTMVATLPSMVPSRIVFAANREGQFDLYMMSLDGTDLTRLTTDPVNDREPVVSLDGKRILFYSERAGIRDLYVIDVDGSDLVRLTYEPSHDEAPAWSPDGERIAFASYRLGNYDIYVANADGSGPVQLTTNLAWDQSPTWSPDGRQIAFVSDRRGYNEIYLMPAPVVGAEVRGDQSGPIGLPSGVTDLASPSWSPDGTRLTFSALDGLAAPGTPSRRSIFVMDVDGGNLTRLTDVEADDTDPTWMPDGRILFASNRNGNFDLYLIDSGGSDLTRLTDTPFDELEPAWVSGF